MITIFNILSDLSNTNAKKMANFLYFGKSKYLKVSNVTLMVQWRKFHFYHFCHFYNSRIGDIQIYLIH